MKRSEIYQEAMRCVLMCTKDVDATIEIIDVLMADKKSALWHEEREKEEQA